MRVAIDARELTGQPTGVGRFLGAVLREWADMPEAAAHQFILCAPSELSDDGAPAYRDEHVKAHVVVEPGDGTLWEQRVLPRLAERAGADVLFCPGYSGPLFGATPLVVAIHDVSFAAHPEWFRWREGLRRRFITRRAARRAARVITISEFSRREISEHLGVPASNIDVIYPGATDIAQRSHPPEPKFRPPSEPVVGPNFSSGMPHEPKEPLLLYVGSIFNRRHVPETIRGFARLTRNHPGVRLAIVGDNRTFPFIDVSNVIDVLGERERVQVLPYVSDEALADLYRRARAFVFLSEYEGFGLTPLEALASGVPIVALDTAVAREVYREAAVYVAAADPHLIEPALEAALFDETARATILQKAPAVLAQYSWRECARRVLEVLRASSDP